MLLVHFRNLFPDIHGQDCIVQIKCSLFADNLNPIQDRRIFKQKRAQQMFAADNILQLEDYAKTYKMVELVLDKLFKVTQGERVNTEGLGTGYHGCHKILFFSVSSSLNKESYDNFT